MTQDDNWSISMMDSINESKRPEKQDRHYILFYGAQSTQITLLIWFHWIGFRIVNTQGTSCTVIMVLRRINQTYVPNLNELSRNRNSKPEIR